jgi:SAM-dependent methyltransferase
MTGSEEFSRERQCFWEDAAWTPKRTDWFSGAYQARLARLYQLNITEGSSVLEIGCGRGDLLAALSPSIGIGVDFCPSLIEEAQMRYPHLDFRCLDAHDAALLDQKFDYIILSDLINDVYDIEKVLHQVAGLCTSETRLLVNFYSHLWAGILKAAQKMGLATRLLEQNWLTRLDFENLLKLSGFETIRTSEEILLPARIPFVSNLVNRTLPRIWPFNHLALAHFVVARFVESDAPKLDSVSIIIAARNESGHISRLIDEIPVMGTRTEVIFVEGGSTDDTYEEIERQLDRRPELEISLWRQSGHGKADAVRLGFEKAKYDILVVLDADISVKPADLERFHRAISRGKGEFINGVRLVYPMQKEAMRFLNLLGNKFFSYGFQYALGQPIKDTLCGTKAISRDNYRRLAQNRGYFGEFDPYGDFDLIFGAAKLNLAIVDIPVRYQARTYGKTNINRWTGGALLLRMLGTSLLRLKFV